jgi:hypothetical protein
MTRNTTVAVLAALSVTFVPTNVLAEGWPFFIPKTATIRRLLPASEDLKHKRINVEATIEPSVTEKGAQTAPGLLRTKLITMVQQDPRLIVDEVHPETLLKLRLTNFFTEMWTGTNDKGAPTKEWRGKMEVSYQAVDLGTNIVVDSDNIAVQVGYPESETRSSVRHALGLGSENLLVDRLVDSIYQSVGQRVSPQVKLETVLLPSGKRLDPVAAFAQTGDWGRVEAEARKMEPFVKPQEDAMRKYLIGLAVESKSYALVIEANEREMGRKPELPEKEARAQFAAAKKLMDEARTIYKEIFDANPSDKNLRPGVSRTDQALSVFSAIERSWAKTDAAKANEIAIARQKAEEAARKSPLDKVLDFCRAGVDANSIGEYINSPDFLEDVKNSNYKFNFATDMVALNNTCKASAAKLQTAMRQRLNPAPTPPVAAPEPPPPAPAPVTATPKAAPKAAPKATPKAAPKPQQ